MSQQNRIGALVVAEPGEPAVKPLYLDGERVGWLREYAPTRVGARCYHAGLVQGPSHEQPLIQGHGETPEAACRAAVANGRAEAARLVAWAAEMERALNASEVDHG